MIGKPYAWMAAALTLLILVALVTWPAAGGQDGSIVSRVSSSRIYGRVVSRYGPVPNARVRIAGQGKYTLTDRQGRFMLEPAHLPGQVLVTAGKEGWFNNGRVAAHGGRMRHIVLNPVPRVDRSDYRFISPVVCARCHVKLTRTYDQSKMAHTTSNPKVLQMYYGTDALNRPGHGPGYKLDNPGRGGDCITCHAPSIAAANPPSKDLLDALRSPRAEWDGISCDYCHKVQQVLKDPDTPSGYRAVFSRQSARSGNSILEFGPYDDVVAPPMAASYNPLFKQGRFCSQCHSHLVKLPKGKTWNWRKVYTPAEWRGFGLKGGRRLPIQTTYQEWKQWHDRLPPGDPDKGKTCQDCHMSWRKDMLPYGHYVVDGAARNMWGTYRDPKNIHPHQFDGGTPNQLKTALSMEIDGHIDKDVLTVTVYVTNAGAGHWVPTGETLRSILLRLDVRDGSGKPLKMIAGKRLPPWADRHSPPRPGAVFARVLQDAAGHPNVPYWRAASVAFDTRIRPKTTVTLIYKFRVADPQDEPTAKAQLVYRPVPRAIAAGKHWNVADIPIASAVW